jgi:hypothetical protein
MPYNAHIKSKNARDKTMNKKTSISNTNLRKALALLNSMNEKDLRVLNTEVVRLSKVLRATKVAAVKSYVQYGTKVIFDTKGKLTGIMRGTVIKVNRTTAQVREADGMTMWRVPLQMLHVINE